MLLVPINKGVDISYTQSLTAFSGKFSCSLTINSAIVATVDLYSDDSLLPNCSAVDVVKAIAHSADTAVDPHTWGLFIINRRSGSRNNNASNSQFLRVNSFPFENVLRLLHFTKEKVSAVKLRHVGQWVCIDVLEKF